MSCAHAIRDKYEIYLSCAHAIRVICRYLLCLFERLQQISAKAFARFAHWTVVLLRFRPNKSSKYWNIKTRRTRKVQNSEACILGIKNIRLTWGLLPVLIFIYMADFSCKMNNKRIIEFGLRRISELFRPRSALSASAFGFGR